MPEISEWNYKSKGLFVSVGLLWFALVLFWAFVISQTGWDGMVSEAILRLQSLHQADHNHAQLCPTFAYNNKPVKIWAQLVFEVTRK